MAVNLHVRGRRSLFTKPNTSLLNISLKQTYIREIRSRDGVVVPVPSHPIVPKLDIITMPFPSQILQDHLPCLFHIWYEFTEKLGYRPPLTAIVPLVTRMVAIAHVLNMYDQVDGDDMSLGYYFSADIEIFIVNGIEIVREEDNDQYFDREDDDLFDEEVTTTGTSSSTSGTEKLKTGKFIGTVKKELGSCCICLEEMFGGKKLAGLPCKHVFHENCILQWLHKSNSCPLCRTPLED